MSKKLGNLIKEARAKKGMSQAALAAAVEGLSAAALGKAERGEAEPTETQVRQIAKALGVTQTSLVEAMSKKPASGSSSSKSAASKSTAAKSSAAKSTAAKSSAAKSTAAKSSAAKSTAAKSTSSKSSSSKTGTASKTTSGTSLKVSATEKKLVELYRAADSDTRKAVISLLKGETPKAEDIISNILNSAVSLLTSASE